ncbi:hypothetical protein ACFY1P_34035 [Streptomyces sp. NPDC001407]|uniref:hypothetical protein n=1 Tax=Streptomyces sp. NPDC001407 TaxID=3364573 RepID=UPI00367C2F66
MTVVLFDVAFLETPEPRPCLFCGVPIEHDCGLYVWGSRTDGERSLVCGPCHEHQVPAAVHRYYQATLRTVAAVADNSRVMTGDYSELDARRPHWRGQAVTCGLPVDQAARELSARTVTEALYAQMDARRQAVGYLAAAA